VAPNTSGDKRTAIIMVKNQEGTLTGNIIVTQDAKPYISLETDVLTVDSEGGSYTLNFSSNINLVVETVGLQPWVTQLGITPLGGYNYTLSVVIAPLPAGSDSRTCELSFHRENDFSFLKTLTILQRPSE
jgi:hypothetical protein